MSRFHRPPSGRRQPRTTAKALALGHTLAGRISRDEQRAVLMPVRLPLENREGYRKRFAPEQRLAIRAFVGGSTLAHVVVTSAERIQLGDVDYSLVRELGHIRLDSFQLSWIREHDEPWWRGVQERLEGRPPTDETFDEFMERFQVRYAHREVWVIRFALDRTATPRMVAQTGHGRVNYRKLPDGRWQCMESTEDAEADRGYTSSLSLSMDREAPDALTDEEWKRHVDGNRDLTHEQWVALGRMTRINEKRRRPPKHLRKAA